MTRMRVFWSVYCILVGIALLVKILFRLDFSGWTVAFAILLLESGVFLVTGGSSASRRQLPADALQLVKLHAHRFQRRHEIVDVVRKLRNELRVVDRGL